MNRPGTAEGNWMWRYREEMLDETTLPRVCASSVASTVAYPIRAEGVSRKRCVVPRKLGTTYAAEPLAV